jgi:hypothetical protein
LLLITVLEVARGRVQIGFTTTAVNTAAVPIQRGEMWTGAVELAGATCQTNGKGKSGTGAISACHQTALASPPQPDRSQCQ